MAILFISRFVFGSLLSKAIAPVSKFKLSGIRYQIANNKKIIPIQSLKQLILLKQLQQEPNFNKEHYEPSEIFLFTVKSIKLSLYQKPEYEDKIIKTLQKYKSNLQYIKVYVFLILPNDHLFPRLNQFYKDISIAFLKSQEKMHKEETFIILQNLQRMLAQMRSQWMDDKWIVKDYSKQQQIANLLVPNILSGWNTSDNSIFIKLTRVCNTLGVRNPLLGQYLLENIKSSECRFKMKDIISVLYYLSNIDTFPYDYFYQNKRRFVSTLESYNKFSTKKSIQSIKLLQLIVLQNPMYCEHILKRIQDILLEAVPSFDTQEISNIWYICCRAKFGIYVQLTEKLLAKIQDFVASMKTKQLCLLVRGFMDFRMMNTYSERVLSILKVIKQKLDKQRAYQHEVLNIIISRLKVKQKQQKAFFASAV